MAILVTLLHNPGAGLDNYSREEVLNWFQDKGFEINYVDVKEEDFKKKLHDPADLYVIAGGDGTVTKIAKHIVGKPIPIGLLPLGTANNIAYSLGICGDPGDIVAAWDLNRRRPFDLGIMKRRPNHEKIFFESAGFGLLPRLIKQHSKDNEKETDRDHEVEKALRHQRQILDVYKPRTCTIYMDGQNLTGDYLLVEIMNVQLAGPNMNLAPRANSGDGLLDVVLVREDERDLFARYLSSQIFEKVEKVQLNVQQTKELRIEWEGVRYHVDGKTYKKEAPLKMEFQVLVHGLEFLLV